MKLLTHRCVNLASCCVLLLPAAHASLAQSSAVEGSSGRSAWCAPSGTSLRDEVRADMEFLASDELHGRGSATRDEHIAVLFAASRFQTLGLDPAGDAGSFVQKVRLPSAVQEQVARTLSGFEPGPRTETWNAIAILRGMDPTAGVVLLTAHLDHLGVGPANTRGDRIYNGADDDASGTAAVLALAHALASGPRLRRSVVFALFGAEELGGLGSAGFLAHPPVPLDSIVTNLQFEMIGRPDPAVGRDGLWLTGYERSNLGPMLAEHGALVSADPHPEQKFFQRSDNIALARRGIVAQTVSSFGLHADYHQPSDELSTLDFHHLEHAISSMVEPIRWLSNTDWRPEWNPGRRP